MLQVVTHRGERREWLADDLDLRPRSKEKVIEELRITAEDYSDILKRPTFLFRVQYGELSFASGQPEWDHLPEILELLKTDLPRDKKRRQLTQWVSEEFSEMLTATPVISDHPQLDARLTRIRTERKAE